ncbi:tyrosine--tRNA ligase [Mycoplasmoides alvi]|uniref:tyrosine--tRNA ligase n=1 Tax=Mycoplasmoides alvi TaxID=78580 RepID=UPI00051C74F6|nr:tyrosine--tRNA ligase [Mycoplasmoides alvi]
MDKKKVFEYLSNRGLIAQTIFPDELKDLVNNKKIKFYIGFDPTADSLHIGHLLTLRVAHILQKHGHQPYVILGGGTGYIGDPTGRTDMRKMLSTNDINGYVTNFQKQIKQFLDFSGENKAIILNNADWLLNLKWIDILRQIGQHISVNKMLSTDAYKSRWERGLTFLELNYMVMQGYDFLYLNQNYDVALQLGGNDQWSNIIAGVDLIRRIELKTAYGMTLTLLTKSDGTKIGKTASGALWLDPNKTSPYSFYQYWINVDDKELKKLFLMLTDFEEEEINQIVNKCGKDIVETKQLLAYTLTKMVHGKNAADNAKEKSIAAFSDNNIDNMPTITVNLEDYSIANLLVESQLAKSKSEARRLILAGGISINNTRITDPQSILAADLVSTKYFVLHKGKKQHIKVVLKD